MKEYCTSHNMFARMQRIVDQQQSLSKDTLRSLLIKWDNDQGRAMAFAERQLIVPPKKCDWSPQLRNAAIIRLYWKLRLREHTGSHNYSSTFLRWQAKLQRSDPTFLFPHLNDTLSVTSIRRYFNNATSTFRKCQRSAHDLRMLSYDNLLNRYEQDKNPLTSAESKSKAKIVRRTIQTESTRSLFANLRHQLKPSDFSQLSKILIPRHKDLPPTPIGSDIHQILEDNDPTDLIWDTVVSKEDMERHLLNFNREAFRAASSSQCGNGRIFEALTFTSLSPEANELLKGILPPDWHGDDQLLREFLLSAFTVTRIVIDSIPISIEVTDDDVIRGFSRWKESTTTSPSGRHLGHYRAIIQDEALLRCITSFLNLILKYGLSIPRWSNATNVLIEKDPGQPKINRLRIIHLFEADYNFVLILMWGSRLVHRADKLNLLHDSQFGSVPRRTTMDPIMMTQLTNDLCRILKHNLVRVNNDASACYDRIIVGLGMLAARRCGMPASAIQTHALALELMKHRYEDDESPGYQV